MSQIMMQDFSHCGNATLNDMYERWNQVRIAECTCGTFIKFADTMVHVGY